jgi:NhaP-type Na+/H+ or K+/H+ antiporter
MLIGQTIKTFSQLSGIPYTTLLMIVGIIVGIYADSMGMLGKGIIEWSRIGPHELLLVFLPALIFESAFNTDWHIIKMEFA